MILSKLWRVLESIATKSRSIPPIIVNTPGYRETTGGTIVMHYLVDRLRHFGLEAYVYPWVDESEHVDALSQGEEIFDSGASERYCEYRLNPHFNTSIATFKDLKRCIAIYPLRVKKNPLQAETVVRWHIYRKSLIPEAEFSNNEIDFYFNEAFYEGSGQFDKRRLLRLGYFLSEYYDEAKGGDRNSDCYMIRKGTSYSEESMKLIPKNAIKLDGCSHSEIARIFKRCKHFYSFDLYTAYEHYAAVCGCIPIVIPRPGMSKFQWRSSEEERYGTAYGVEDVDWAVNTRTKLLELQKDAREYEMETVKDFANFIARRGSVRQIG